MRLYKDNPFSDFPYEDMMFWPDITALLQKIAEQVLFVFFFLLILFGVRLKLPDIVLHHIFPAMLIEAEPYDSFRQIIYYAEQRNADDHSDHAPVTAEKQNSEQDPKTRNADLISEDLGTDDIPIDLLKDDDEYNEDNAFVRTLSQNQNR